MSTTPPEKEALSGKFNDKRTQQQQQRGTFGRAMGDMGNLFRTAKQRITNARARRAADASIRNARTAPRRQVKAHEELWGWLASGAGKKTKRKKNRRKKTKRKKTRHKKTRHKKTQHKK